MCAIIAMVLNKSGRIGMRTAQLFIQTALIVTMIGESDMIELAGYGLAGFLQDTLLTGYQKCVLHNQRLRAALLSASIAVISIYVISRVTASIQKDQGLIPLGLFAIGKMLGTYYGLGSLHGVKAPETIINASACSARRERGRNGTS